MTFVLLLYLIKYAARFSHLLLPILTSGGYRLHFYALFRKHFSKQLGIRILVLILHLLSNFCVSWTCALLNYFWFLFRKVPSLLEYFSYLFHYSTLLAGPVCTFREFNDFIDGSDIRPKVLITLESRMLIGSLNTERAYKRSAALEAQPKTRHLLSQVKQQK